MSSASATQSDLDAVDQEIANLTDQMAMVATDIGGVRRSLCDAYFALFRCRVVIAIRRSAEMLTAWGNFVMLWIALAIGAAVFIVSDIMVADRTVSSICGIVSAILIAALGYSSMWRMSAEDAVHVLEKIRGIISDLKSQLRTLKSKKREVAAAQRQAQSRRKVITDQLDQEIVSPSA